MGRFLLVLVVEYVAGIAFIGFNGVGIGDLLSANYTDGGILMRNYIITMTPINVVLSVFVLDGYNRMIENHDIRNPIFFVMFIFLCSLAGIVWAYMLAVVVKVFGLRVELEQITAVILPGTLALGLLMANQKMPKDRSRCDFGKCKQYALNYRVLSDLPNATHEYVCRKCGETMQSSGG
ncbi:hypothetical protein HL658_26315 [Azospirillum sp. RWY-5-1]|uniref:Uncharacterized protein n=1 Tax=Azospirillum oleiclasticum TaxID=2735135 RepID=A0ABX2TF34_9PROT|nr:hypothetical protein [Azospirillum oleiclasticum]NYZ16069.1 hypothetical protein [Azospirillum oleiclasticum]NYZ22950.1 hypothetical protein [Azospirillum oleiclasticum]